jgi:hypothetical protein
MDKISAWLYDGHSPECETLSTTEFLASAQTSGLNAYLDSLISEEDSYQQ